VIDLFGMKIYSSPYVRPVPRLKVSPNVNISDSVRNEVDAYLLETFGVMDVAYIFNDDALGLCHMRNAVLLNPAQFAMIKEQP
jgi:hypothetical protein